MREELMKLEKSVEKLKRRLQFQREIFGQRENLVKKQVRISVRLVSFPDPTCKEFCSVENDPLV